MNQISTPCSALSLIDQGADLSLAAASEPTLASQARSARDAFTRLDDLIAGALNGRFRISRQELKFGFVFACACIANPNEAAKLPDWERAAVRQGTNPYYQPLKYAARGVADEITAKLTMWAAIYRHAAEGGVTADTFLDALKLNHGVRAWYESLRKPANDNAPLAEAAVATVSFGKPANDNRPEESAGIEAATPVAVESPPTPGTAPEAAATLLNVGGAEPQLGLVLLDLAAVESGVLASLDQGGYPGLVRLHGIASPAVIRLLNENGFDAHGIRGAAR